MSSKKLKVTLVRSKHGRGRVQRACVDGLGLRRVNHAMELDDTAAVRGMIHKVIHLVEVEEVINEA